MTQTDYAPEVEARSKLAGLLRAFFVDVIWLTLKRIPLNVLAWTAGFVLAGYVVAYFSVPLAGLDEKLSTAAFAGLLIGFAAAGFLLGLLRALHAGAERAVEIVGTAASRLIDRLLDPLADSLGGDDRQLPLAEVRESCRQLVEEAELAEPRRGPLGWLSRATRALIRQGLRIRFRKVSAVFDSLLADGTTHMSATDVKDLVRDKLVWALLFGAQRQTRVVEWTGYVLGALLVILPLAALWLGSRFAG